MFFIASPAGAVFAEISLLHTPDEGEASLLLPRQDVKPPEKALPPGAKCLIAQVIRLASQTRLPKEGQRLPGNFPGPALLPPHKQALGLPVRPMYSIKNSPASAQVSVLFLRPAMPRMTQPRAESVFPQKNRIFPRSNQYCR